MELVGGVINLKFPNNSPVNCGLDLWSVLSCRWESMEKAPCPRGVRKTQEGWTLGPGHFSGTAAQEPRQENLSALTSTALVLDRTPQQESWILQAALSALLPLQIGFSAIISHGKLYLGPSLNLHPLQFILTKSPVCSQSLKADFNGCKVSAVQDLAFNVIGTNENDFISGISTLRLEGAFCCEDFFLPWHKRSPQFSNSPVLIWHFTSCQMSAPTLKIPVSAEF